VGRFGHGVGTEMMGRPLSASIFLPSSSFVPFMRTTKGTFRLVALQAVITPVAMVSHFMMPPKMLTKNGLDLGVLQHDLEGFGHLLRGGTAAHVQEVGGLAPNSLMVSMVAMARPAPFTKQPMLPSRLM
jgi:hypothetical protein